jgi:hypothetical protein
LGDGLELQSLGDNSRGLGEARSSRVTQSLADCLNAVITDIIKWDEINLIIPIAKKDQELEIKILRAKIAKLQPKRKIPEADEAQNNKRLILLYKQRLWQLGVKDQKDDDGKILAWEELPIVKVIKIRDKYVPAIIAQLNTNIPNDKIINHNTNKILKILLRKDKKITETPNFNLRMLGGKLSVEIELLSKRINFVSQSIDKEEARPATNVIRPAAGSSKTDKSKS